MTAVLKYAYMQKVKSR